MQNNQIQEIQTKEITWLFLGIAIFMPAIGLLLGLLLRLFSVTYHEKSLRIIKYAIVSQLLYCFIIVLASMGR